MDGVLSSDRFPNLSNLKLQLSLDFTADESIPIGPTANLLAKEVQQGVQKKLKRLLPSLSKSGSAQIDVNIEVHGCHIGLDSQKLIICAW